MITLTRDAALASTTRGPSGSAAEQYFALVQQLRPAGHPASAAATVGVTACARGACVSTVAANLAAAAAQTGQRTLLVDLSSTHPALAARLAMSGDLGLREALACAARPAECVKATSIPNLSLLAVNNGDDSRVLSVDAARMHELFRSLEQDFHFIVVDLPVTDSGVCMATAGMLDGVLLVMESERTNSQAALRATQRLVHANAKLLGVILNKHREHLPSWLDARL
jgi:Mrp family chromosome partitioning ATPase